MLICFDYDKMENELKLLKHRIFNIKINIFFVCSGLLWIFSPNGIDAVESYSRDSAHRGVVDLAPYQIYPENRMGNGIYLNKKLLATHPQRVILNIVSIKDTESHVYLFRGENGVLGLNIVKGETDGEARFWQVDPEFYQYSNNTTGIKRIFRIFRNDVKPVLPFLRTGSGVSTSATHAVFYHVSNSKEITYLNASGQEITGRIYTFRLHVINRKLDGFKSIFNLQIQDVNYSLKLVWENEHSVSYKLANGKKHTVDLLKYVPELF